MFTLLGYEFFSTVFMSFTIRLWRATFERLFGWVDTPQVQTVKPGQVLRATGWLTMFFLSTLTVFAAIGEYQLDLTVPVDPTTMPTPRRVEIYVRGPHEYINKADTPSRLSSISPACTLTNETEIRDLISVLAVHSYKEEITAINRRKGITCHLLLFRDDNKTVMHYRVFQPMDLKTQWCMVDPQNETGFCYFNDKIAAWLQKRIESFTNSSFAPREASTNTPVKPVKGSKP